MVFFCVNLKDTSEFIGMIGLHNVSFKSHFTPAVEVGWRLVYENWNKGYATEGAKAELEFGFNVLNLEEIVSFTTVKNTRSQAVMKKLGMKRDYKDDFDHPEIAYDNLLKKHVLYRLRKDEFNLLLS